MHFPPPAGLFNPHHFSACLKGRVLEIACIHIGFPENFLCLGVSKKHWVFHPPNSLASQKVWTSEWQIPQ